MKGGARRERRSRGGGAIPGALTAALGVAVCLGAVAYAAAPRGAAGPGAERRPARARLPMPTITHHPDKLATSTRARFGFTVRGRNRRFLCRLDRRGWRACRAPIVFAGLSPGAHAFAVRAADRRRRHGRAARFRWTLLAPKGFSIEPQLAGLGPLYPGAPPEPLPLTISNPNPVPIHVTSLRVAATADPPGCASAANLELTPSSVSSAAPLRVPARGSVGLPAEGASAPAIQLRDLPVNQDACQRAQFPLAFSGEARG
ncbi:MAG TPA: hypothetical protein VNO20_02755 [Solirubrobacterales bacterium]|nr:hypothetical protein [Solirubrobacterales bacterium]